MLRALTLPGIWGELLQMMRPVFRRSSTFGLFALLATGLVTRTTRRTVVGMLAGAGMAAVVSFHSACRFFSQYAWDTDRLGLAVARLIVDRLLPDRYGDHRRGRRHLVPPLGQEGASRVLDPRRRRPRPGQARPRQPVGDRRDRGAAAVLQSSGVPADAVSALGRQGHRLPGGAGRPDAVHTDESLPAQRYPRRWRRRLPRQALLVAGTTITTRLPANAALHAPAPPRTGRRGRPAKKGQRLPRLAELAATATWRTLTVHRYGRADTVAIAVIDCLWYGAFGDTAGRAVLAREPDTDTGYDLALFTTDRHSDTERIVERYAERWSIEPANAIGKQLLGVGQARNRVAKAVERTVPFGFLVQTLVIIWYALYGYHPDDLASRHAAEPWYHDKSEPAFEDMLAKLRRTLIAARFSGTTPNQPDPNIIRDYQLACAAAAA